MQGLEGGLDRYRKRPAGPDRDECGLTEECQWSSDRQGWCGVERGHRSLDRANGIMLEQARSGPEAVRNEDDKRLKKNGVRE
ncbi:hypothetical protein LZ31DRAFT_558763 [Colletotrichum somersetense]|nr:hypothetical protein LZ31DRAFT_558763 [Colletotrichum somersetense]